jgi:K+-transporting ATPase ATPase C chain
MKPFIISLKIFLFFTILTGIIYPLFVTGIAQIAFPVQANGSLIRKDQVIIGSKLLGQQNDSNIFFSSRPSAISYNTLPSGGSNYGLTNLKLKELVAERKRHFIAFNQLDSMTVVPSEMLFASASGLDPHISVNGAMLQVNRIAKARKLSATQKQQLIQSVNALKEAPQFLCLGEERINVLLLNLNLDELVAQP